MEAVSIRGGGVAACCCAHLLQDAGLRVAWERSDRARLPAILLGTAAQALICDIFGKKDLFSACHRIHKRVVAWSDGPVVTLDHSAVVVSEQELLGCLRPDVQRDGDAAAWTIFSSNLQNSTEHAFGTRIASAAPVELAADANACAIESLEEGWLFLLPDSADSGWLLAVGGAAENLLARSRVIAPRIARAGPAEGSFAAYPRIAAPLGGPGWLACGSAAMGFDPICGDGAANALRQAILASAVIRAALQGAEVNSLLSHYEARLKLGFKRHLELCRAFYQSGRRGPWWDRERNALQQGIEWCGHEPHFQYHLAGFDLRAVRA